MTGPRACRHANTHLLGVTMTSTVFSALDLAPPADSAGARRTLIAVHGHEPEGWAHEVRAAVPRRGLVRVLLADDPPAAVCTSLLPAARRRHAAALDQVRRERDGRRRAALELLVAGAGDGIEVLRLPRCADPGRAIAEHARDWPADLVVMGRDARSRIERALTGTIHERVVSRAPCAVLVVQGRGRERRPIVARLPWRLTARGGA